MRRAACTREAYNDLLPNRRPYESKRRSGAPSGDDDLAKPLCEAWMCLAKRSIDDRYEEVTRNIVRELNEWAYSLRMKRVNDSSRSRFANRTENHRNTCVIARVIGLSHFPPRHISDVYRNIFSRHYLRLNRRLERNAVCFQIAITFNKLFQDERSMCLHVRYHNAILARK